MSRHVEAALSEVRRYFHDEIPPESAAGAVATLIAQPADVLMRHIDIWSNEQTVAQSRTVSELLLHALRKIYVTGELELLDREAIATYLDRATSIALRICPIDDRDALRTDLAEMRKSRTTFATLEQYVPPPPPAPPPVHDAVAEAEAQIAKRFELIVDRLMKRVESAGQAGTQPDQSALAQLLSMAATRSQSGQQFNDYLEQLRPLTGKEGNVFVILGGAMPSWDVTSLAPGTSRPPAQVGAMEKIIDLAEDPALATNRLRELVVAAIQKFNDGSIAAATWMLDLAEDTIKERKLDQETVERIRSEAVGAIGQVPLRKYTENKNKRAALRIFLGFFPKTELAALFTQLRGEQRAERRRELLAFIEAYGPQGREAAVDQLVAEQTRADVDTYYLRNLIFLLHRIPRESNDEIDRELETLTKASERGQNIYVAKEAATAMGQIRTEAAARVLTMRLAEYEAMLLRNDVSQPPEEVQKLLDRIVGSLARIGTSSALLTIARHGMNANPLLGDTRSRLASLALHDLSFDEATVSVLLKALRGEIPGKLFGLLLPKRQESTVRLIEALSGTRSPATEEIFREIAQRFPGEEIGKAASAVLTRWSPAEQVARPESAATLAGELEFFGLPSVMQSLAEMRATGILTLSSRQGQVTAKIAAADGKFVDAQTGRIRGPEAVYEMLERPVAGSFAFVPQPIDALKVSGVPRDFVGLLLEGVRRQDELQALLALIPDDLTLAKGQVKPTPLEDESDPALVREIWTNACSGSPISTWRLEANVDSYRVRRLVAHWLEQEALLPKP